ncbi:hypothetical protein AB0H98_04490 [Nocardia salmonicida]|uniref:hypothetical protein n=1 Tax=Nocardia salmonicida TaxID=53431 RepID=UPI0033C94E61
MPTGHGLITGFVSERSNGGSGTADTDWLTHGVMRFRDAAHFPARPCCSPRTRVCVVTGGRYVAEVWGKTQDETHAAAREQQQRVLAAAK